MQSFFSAMHDGMSADQWAAAFASIERHPLAIEYMETNLKQLREWAESPNTREDVTEFLSKTQDVPEEAIVALSLKGVSLLSSDEGTLLAFA